MEYKYSIDQINELTKEELLKINVEDSIYINEDIDIPKLLMLPKVQFILRRSGIKVGGQILSISRTELYEYLEIKEEGKLEVIKLLNNRINPNTQYKELKNYLLPIGSIIKIRDIDKSIAITGRGYSQGKEKGYTDYLGIAYPEGMINNNVLVFNQEDIEKVEHIGLQNEEEYKIEYYVKRVQE